MWVGWGGVRKQIPPILCSIAQFPQNTLCYSRGMARLSQAEFWKTLESSMEISKKYHCVDIAYTLTASFHSCISVVNIRAPGDYLGKNVLI